MQVAQGPDTTGAGRARFAAGNHRRAQSGHGHRGVRRGRAGSCSHGVWYRRWTPPRKPVAPVACAPARGRPARSTDAAPPEPKSTEFKPVSARQAASAHLGIDPWVYRETVIGMGDDPRVAGYGATAGFAVLWARKALGSAPVHRAAVTTAELGLCPTWACRRDGRGPRTDPGARPARPYVSLSG